MPRRNRVDPWGDLQAVPARGLFTGNRGCLVDDDRRLVRHHHGNLWIICLTEYRGWRSPLDGPRHWTPLFFLDDAVALAAGHRPCGLCRRPDHRAYQAAVARGLGSAGGRPSAHELNRRLSRERMRPGRGLERAAGRLTWTAPIEGLPAGTVIVGADGAARLVGPASLQGFAFAGWQPPEPRPRHGLVTVLTPPTSVLALEQGFRPVLHHSATPGPTSNLTVGRAVERGG